MKLTINKPQQLAGKNRRDRSVAEAMSTIYKNSEGWMLVLEWNRTLLLLDGTMLSGMFNDLIRMMASIERNEPAFSISFLDSGFTAMWYFELDGDNLAIDARWTSVVTEDPKGLEHLRNEHILKISKTAFSDEWKTLLKAIREDLLKAGYTNRLDGFHYLEELNR